MTLFSRATATLAYLVAILLLGGASAAGFNGNLLLQILGALLIGWTLLADPDEAPQSTGLKLWFVALAVLMAVQFVPLPPGLWRALPGRDLVYQGFVALGVDAPWMTLSLLPWKSLASFVWWIPALAVFLSMRAPGAPATRHVIWTIATVAVVSIGIGAMQRLVDTGYFYTFTNRGEGPGFFANSNHQGSFLLCALALFGGWLIQQRVTPAQLRPLRGGTLTALTAIAGLLALGVLISGSLACLALLVPLALALALMTRPDLRVSLPAALAGLAVVGAAVVAFLIYGPVANDLTAKGAISGISRQDFLVTGAQILRNFAPFGSGSGTFVDLYRWYENPAEVGTTYVNHAHDDLLELLIETGVFGLVVVAIFLLWFIPRAVRLWQGDRRNSVALAATVVIAVELMHSLVEYPLRTAAMSTIVAIALVLLGRPPELTGNRDARRPRSNSQGDGTVRI